jgi:hypothetical protein
MMLMDGDLSSLDERHLRHLFSEVIVVYWKGMQDVSRGVEEQLRCAQLLESALTRFQSFLWQDQQAELDQLARQIGDTRSSCRRSRPDE